MTMSFVTEKQLSKPNLITGCAFLESKNCSNLEIVLRIAVQEFWPALSEILIQPNRWVFMHEWPA